MEQALKELDSQMEELRKVQEEQDALAAKTAEVTHLAAVVVLLLQSFFFR